MILKYEDGARRVVGICRPGVDRYETVCQPARICFTRIITGCFMIIPWPINGYAVDVCDVWEHSHLKGWTCCKWTGLLEHWYDDTMSALTSWVERNESAS